MPRVEGSKMSEEFKGQEISQNNQELVDDSREKIDQLLNEKANEAKNNHAEKIEETLENSRAEANETAQTAEEVIAKRESEAEEPDGMPALVNKDLKDTKYKRTLQSVRKDLNAPERALSKIVHNPIVDAISAGAEKTIARPSGLLAGSICAFVGSSLFLYIAKHYGYTYNFLLMSMFFVGGFGLGLLIELVSRTVKHSR
jgi:hypothetical protein